MQITCNVNIIIIFSFYHMINLMRNFCLLYDAGKKIAGERMAAKMV